MRSYDYWLHTCPRNFPAPGRRPFAEDHVGLRWSRIPEFAGNIIIFAFKPTQAHLRQCRPRDPETIFEYGMSAHGTFVAIGPKADAELT